MVTINPGDSNFATGTSTIAGTSRNIIYEPELADVPVTTGGRPAPLSRVPWGAVIAGTLGAISLMVLSASLAYACHVSAFGYGQLGSGIGMGGGSPDTGYTIGAGIWAVVTSFVAFFLGGLLAAHLSSTHRGSHGMVHGLMTWVLGIPLLLVLGTSAGGLFRTFVINDAVRTNISNASMQTIQTGAAWGAFFVLLVGLIGAALGGASMLLDRDNRIIDRQA